MLPISVRNWIRGMAGLLLGGVFLWLALRQTSVAQVQAILAQSHAGWLEAAIAFYATNMVVRVCRWRLLLREIKKLSFADVGTALMIGYAANNLLPARLGEVVRADFTGRQYGISRTAIAGSILVERVLDGLAVVACLAIGRLFLSDQPILSALTLAGTLLFSSIFLTLWVLQQPFATTWLKRFPPAFTRRVHHFQMGLNLRPQSGFGQAVGLTIGVWLLEGFALWSIVKAVDVGLTLQQLLALIGVTSLSTLLPSAPGFVGTYQYSYAFTLGLFGYSASRAVAAATAFQIFLFGGVTLIGLAAYLYRNLQNLTKVPKS